MIPRQDCLATLLRVKEKGPVSAHLKPRSSNLKPKPSTLQVVEVVEKSEALLVEAQAEDLKGRTFFLPRRLMKSHSPRTMGRTV